MRRVFVLLPDGLDTVSWGERWAAGLVPDQTPYGYHHASQWGCEITFSSSQPARTGLAALPFKVMRRLLGFDVEHAWNHRAALWSAQTDIVWTHTEREFLPVAWLSQVMLKRCPPMIGQIVWLADQWPSLHRAHQWLQRRLMRQVSMCTCLSPDNLGFLQDMVGSDRARLVEFGIAPELVPPLPLPPPEEVAGRPIRVLSLGNDRHRDWTTLGRAVRDHTGLEVFIGSSTCPDSVLGPHVRREVCDLKQVKARMAWCDVVVIPLVFNRHASGLTVMLEAVANGKPVIVSRTGGMTHYFTDDHVTYVEPGQPHAIRDAIDGLWSDAARTQETAARVRRARLRLDEMAFTTPGFAHRHVLLSEHILTR